jgi:hypothetical protein
MILSCDDVLHHKLIICSILNLLTLLLGLLLLLVLYLIKQVIDGELKCLSLACFSRFRDVNRVSHGGIVFFGRLLKDDVVSMTVLGRV